MVRLLLFAQGEAPRPAPGRPCDPFFVANQIPAYLSTEAWLLKTPVVPQGNTGVQQGPVTFNLPSEEMLVQQTTQGPGSQ